MNIYNCIEYSSASDTAVKDVFSTLRDTATLVGKRQFLEDLSIGEEEYMVDHFSDVPEARKKNGQWKFRTYLPGSYTSSRSVIVTALELGISVSNKGKTAIQKEIKLHKDNSKEVKSDYQKALGVVTTLHKIYIKLDDEEQNSISSLIREKL